MEFLAQAHNQHIYDFMISQPCVALATHGSSDDINLAHVFVEIDERFNLFFISRPENRKVVNILDNCNVSVLFSDKDTVEQVEYIGSATPIVAPDEITEHLTALQKVVQTHKKEYWIPPVSQIGGDGYQLFRIVPKSVVYRRYSEATSALDKTVEFAVDFNKK